MVLALVNGADAQDRAEADEGSFAPPPPPLELRPFWTIEFTATASAPLQRDTLCPDDADCIYSGGGGVGAALAWRFPRGLSVGFGYDVSFLDGNGVYEITTQHFFSGDVRYYGLRSSLVHPYVGASLGLVILGDAFQDNVFGAGLDVGAGLEIELTSTLAFTLGISGFFFSTGSFRSDSDGVRRSDSFGVNGSLLLRVGLVLSERPSAGS
ncbi:MAG: hypothetical protein AAF938_20580 [Myxococcota bacterium]